MIRLSYCPMSPTKATYASCQGLGLPLDEQFFRWAMARPSYWQASHLLAAKHEEKNKAAAWS